MLLCAMAASLTASLLLSECVDAVGRPATLPLVTEKAWGAPLRVFSDVSVLVQCFGSATGYLIAVGDTMPAVVSTLFGGGEHMGGLFMRRELWIIVFVVCVIAPLSFLRRMDSLRFASFLVILAASIIVATVCLFAVGGSSFDAHLGCEQGMSRCRGDRSFLSEPEHVAKALPVFVFAYAYHSNLVPVASELDTPTRHRMLEVIGGSLLVCSTVFICLSGLGYMTFGDSVDSDLLLSYPETKAVILARFALVYVVALSYPVLSYPVPYNVDSLVAALTCAPADATANAAAEASTHSHTLFITNMRHRGYVALWLLATTSTAMRVTDLGLLISLAGAVASSGIVFLIPGICYLRLLPGASRCLRVLAGMMVGFGTGLLPGLVYVVLDGY